MKIDNRDIFEQVGNVFYAVAAGQNVKALKVDDLKSLIAKDWLPRAHGSEPVASHEAHCILMTMDALEASRTTARDAFKEFSKFYDLHSHIFTADVKQRILATAEEIDQAFQTGLSHENAQLIRLRDLVGYTKLQNV